MNFLLLSFCRYPKHHKQYRLCWLWTNTFGRGIDPLPPSAMNKIARIIELCSLLLKKKTGCGNPTSSDTQLNVFLFTPVLKMMSDLLHSASLEEYQQDWEGDSDRATQDLYKLCPTCNTWIQDIPLSTKTFIIITCHHILEHLVAIKKFIKIRLEKSLFFPNPKKYL